MRTVIMAGGLGTRLAEESASKPKPLVEIGGRPILWHIMKIYASHGFREFVVALGYKGELIKYFFLNLYRLGNDLTIDLKDGQVEVHECGREDWRVHLHDTGADTLTGGRLKRLKGLLDGGTFMMTYGDGVADVNIPAVLAFHKKMGRIATVTAVRPPARFGGLEFNGDLVAAFSEKPQVGEGWVNGGFFILEPGVFDYIDSDQTSFEREPLERLADAGQLAVFRHEGFWQCMDTVRDVRYLNDLWEAGESPWKIWE
ncbi:MAG: glucose-1-phosphate cytidylyltransferase [Chthoniobacterales bacterium]|nr:glucose-1-phosphate cytidylyltransferase [Chthoniobacterales bacterium]